jgi:hypothetical protein
VLAISVHQDRGNSSDLSFDLELKGELKSESPILNIKEASFPVVKNSTWYFNDQGKDLGTSWTAPLYDHSKWKYGPGVLGYGDPVSTTLSFGSNSSNKIITYYFRHAFNVDNASQYGMLVFNIRRDDGAVVYLNGVEQFRTNMPTGTITYTTRAASVVGGSDESRYYTFKVPSTQLKNGMNVLAVSVHQDQPTSSDLTFDMEVKGELKSQLSYHCDPGATDKLAALFLLSLDLSRKGLYFLKHILFSSW